MKWFNCSGSSHDSLTAVPITMLSRMRWSLPPIRKRITPPLTGSGVASDVSRLQASPGTSWPASSLNRGSHPPFLPGGTVAPEHLIPLILGKFTSTQEKLVCSACDEWGQALDPANPEETATMIRSAVSPLSLPDLLSPHVTRMQRFPAFLALEAGEKIPLPGTIPFFEADDRILIAPSE